MLKIAAMDYRQLLMDFFGSHEEKDPVQAPASEADMQNDRARGQRRRLLQRAVLAHLHGEEPPTGAALDVPTRISRFKADVGAFWSRPVRNSAELGPSRILEPKKTMLVQCHAEREECWGDVTRSDALMPAIEQRKAERRELEEKIREQEPELKDPNTLFEEYAEWHYDRTRNRRYHQIQKEIRRLEHALMQGTRFEQIRAAHVADELYLAVPAHLIDPDELADGWGLLWVHSDLSIEVRRECVNR